ncbi:MAG: TonB-dependent siderophore receptor [Novosphingobium sp.]
MSSRSFRFALFLGCSLPTAALAQSQPEQAGSDGREDIIVIATGQSKATSASKAETPLVESPQTISVISREEMDVRAVATVADAVAYTAGVQAESFGIDSRTDEITVRGFGAGGFSSNNNFVDGLRLPAAGQFTRTQFDPFGLQQVEVLKGPSSVLYGQTAPGGIINMVSKRPTTDFRGEVMLQAAGFNDLGRWQYTAAGDVSGAINESGTISARLVGLARDGQTQIQKTSNSRYYVSPSITFAPTDRVSWTVLGQYQRDEGGSTYQFLPATGTLYESNGRRIALDEYIGEPDFNTFNRDQLLIGSFFRAEINENVTFRSNVRYTHLKTEYQVTVLSGDTLTAAGCATMLASYPTAFAGCIPGQTIGRRGTQAKGESDGIALDNQLQFKFATGGIRHNVIAGIDYFHTDWSHYRDLAVTTGVPTGQVLPLIDIYNPVYRGASYTFTPQLYYETINDQLGLYAQDQIEIGRLRLSIGGRQDWAYDRTKNVVSGRIYRTRDDDFTWRAGAVYLFDNGLAPYFSYSQSFQPSIGDPATQLYGEPFRPTTGEQYEGGLRFEAPNNRAYVTLGAYQIKQRNVLSTAQLPYPSDSVCVASTCYIQTGEIRMRGIELEAKAQTRFGVTLIGSASRIWSKITESEVAGETGNRVPQVPKLMASAFVDYRFPEGFLNGLGLGGGVRYTGESVGNNLNTLVIPAYTLFDLFLRYDFGRASGQKDGLSLSLNARNLANKTYVATCSSVASCFYGSGRTVTARIQYRW